MENESKMKEMDEIMLESTWNIIEVLSRAPDSQIDTSITARLKELIGKPADEIKPEIKKILDDCVFGGLASGFGIITLQGLYSTLNVDEEIRLEQEQEKNKMENQNSVCFVAKIKYVMPIEGADNIELAFIQGWGSIVQKGKHKEGDLVVVATVDAVIPQILSDSINVTNYLRKGQRVRTVKLRGVYSECLIIPVAENGLYEGKDMMERLKIYKYEPPAVQIQLASGKKIRYHQNPNFLVYYKFPNMKNVSGMFDENDLVQITRKLHGTNARYGIVKKNKLSLWDKIKKFFRLADEWIDYEYVYGSHNVEKGSDSQGFYSTDVWKTVADANGFKDILWDIAKSWGQIGSGIVMYGEIYGAGIQKGYDYGLKDIQFAAFDFMMDGEYMTVDFVEHTCNVYSIPHVPILFDGWWTQEVQDSFVFNNNIEGTKVPHEGIVVKHVNGKREKIAKVINPDYLIYSEKHNVGDSH